MLTLYYVAATWFQSWRIHAMLQRVSAALGRNGSLVVHQELPPYIYVAGGGGAVSHKKLEVDGILSKKCMNVKSSKIADLLWYSNNKRFLSVFPKQILDISGWIAVISGRTTLPLQFKGTKLKLDDEKVLILLEADYNTCQFETEGNSIEVENYATPIAWYAEQNLSILLETDKLHLASLCVAFQNDVTLENGIQLIRFQTVDVEGTPYEIQNIASVPQTYAALAAGLDRDHMKDNFMSRWRAHVSLLCTFCEAVQQVKDSLQDIAVRHPGSGVGAVRLKPSKGAEAEVVLVPENSVPEPIEDNPLSKQQSVDMDSTTAPVEPSSPSSLASLSHETTLPTRPEGSVNNSMASLGSLPSTPKRVVRTSSLRSETPTKPPNIVIFSDSSSALDSVKLVLDLVLSPNKYSIHAISSANALSKVWFSHSSLVVVHGNVSEELKKLLIEYYVVIGGSILCLCSDLLGTFLPVFRTAEVKPNELVQCSYKTWKHVPLLHHLFCYQPAPSTPQFSHDDKSYVPTATELRDKEGNLHTLKVEILGTEETWRTPSLLLVSSKESSAKIIFSQVHLEVDPSQYEIDETKRKALEKSDRSRLEILCDVLGNYFGIQCSLQRQSKIDYHPAYFLGLFETKKELLDRLREKNLLDSNNTFECGEITLKFLGKGVSPSVASASQLPVLMHACPATFSTVDYFENLKTKEIGRIVIYSQIMNTTMFVSQAQPLRHGLAVIADIQTRGVGRGTNNWLSPEGCAMFTLQLQVPMSSFMGQHLSLIQHMTSLSVVSAICQLPGLEELDIGLKWPNDIFTAKTSKIGGVTVSSSVIGELAVCNIGCGVNLSNKKPTTCINDLIQDLNKETRSKVPILSKEKYFCSVFNVLEDLYTKAQEGNINAFYELYYKYWLHGDAEVQVKAEGQGVDKTVKIKGIDRYGFLVVEADDGSETALQPDSNSFDMMSGLILPKLIN